MCLLLSIHFVCTYHLKSCPDEYIYLGDNCIQNFHLGRYIVGYTVRILVLQRGASGAINWISEHISDDIPPQMKILNMVIPILMHCYSLVSNWCVASRTKAYIIQQILTRLMTSNYFRQYIAGFTVANF